MLTCLYHCNLQVGAFGGPAAHLVVWNILTRGAWWSLPLAVSCLAVDPAGDHFAVVATNLAPATAEGDDGQSAAAAADLRGAQAVLAFRPASPQPTQSWASRRPLSAVLFAQPTTAVHFAAQRIAPQVGNLLPLYARSCHLGHVFNSSHPLLQTRSTPKMARWQCATNRLPCVKGQAMVRHRHTRDCDA